MRCRRTGLPSSQPIASGHSFRQAAIPTGRYRVSAVLTEWDRILGGPPNEMMRVQFWVTVPESFLAVTVIA
jgi:hypothetical protein